MSATSTVVRSGSDWANRDSSLISTVIYRKSLWERPLGWLGLTAGKPQGGGLRVWGVASGSAASHPNSGSPDLVEFGEESQKFRNESSPDQRAVVSNFAACQGEAPAGPFGTLGCAAGPPFQRADRNAGVRTPEILGKIVPIGRIGL